MRYFVEAMQSEHENNKGVFLGGRQEEKERQERKMVGGRERLR